MWLFQPAATGWYLPKAPQPAHPVPVLANPWPRGPVRGGGRPVVAVLDRLLLARAEEVGE